MKNSKIVYLNSRCVETYIDNFDSLGMSMDLGIEYIIPKDACLDGLK